MRQIKILAVLFALLPGIAAAQQVLPKNTVWGRLGITASGPAQAIPFATLFADNGLPSGPVTCSSHNWFNTLSAVGALGCSQPSFADISGTVPNAQLAHSSTTVNGVVCTLGSPCTIIAGPQAPGTTTDKAIATWNGTVGAALNNTGVLVDASNDVTMPALVGIGASWLASVDLRLYSPSRAVVQRYEQDQNLSIASLIGNSVYFGKNASGTSLQWAGFTAGVDDCRFKVSLAGSPCAANEASAGTETGAWYLGTQNGSGMNNVLKGDDDGVYVLGSRDLNLSAGRGIAYPDGSRTITDVLSYNSGAAPVCTVTIASPAVFSCTAHGLSINDAVYITTTGALPTGLTASTASSSTGKSTTVYYVIAAGFGANAFEVSTTLGGSAVNTTGSQSGVHTVVEGIQEVDIQSCNGVGLNCAANGGIYMVPSAGKRVFGVKSNGVNVNNPTIISTVHNDAQGSAPTNGCAGASLNGDDHAGRVVTTSTSCTVTFAVAYVNQITACVVTFRAGAGTKSYTCNVNGITVSGLSGSSETFDYIVFGN